MAGIKAEELIETVRMFPALYDQAQEQYRNSEYKDIMWKKVAKKLNVEDSRMGASCSCDCNPCPCCDCNACCSSCAPCCNSCADCCPCCRCCCQCCDSNNGVHVVEHPGVMVVDDQPHFR